MPFSPYTPTATKLVTLSRADGSELLKAATTNVSLEQLADAVAYGQETGYIASASWSNDPGMSNVSEVASLYNFGSTSYAPNTTDANALSVTLAGVRLNDIIHIDASLSVLLPASTTAFVRIGVTHGGGAEYSAPCFRTGQGSALVQFVFTSRVVASAAGSTRVRVIGRAVGGVGNYNVDGTSTLRATLLRAP